MYRINESRHVMRKIFDKKTIITFIISGILFGSIGVYAASYLAKDIYYQPSDSNWKVNNVNEAINSLYSMKNELSNLKSIGDATASDIANGKTAVVQGELVTGNASPNASEAVQYGGQYANLNSTTFSLTGIPNYNKLILNKNLFVRVSIVQGRNGGLAEVQSYVNISYDSSTGTLSVVNANTGCFVYFYVYYIPQE